MSSSNSSLEREIDDYQDVTSGSDGSYESSDSSTASSESSDEHYSSGVPGIPLEEFQELQRRKASTSGASSSRQPPSPQDEEEEIIYSCAPEVASILDDVKLKTLVDRYQIPKEFNPRLPKEGEWCCSPSLGVYSSYLLAGLRFPLNSFLLDLTNLTPMDGGR